MAIFNCTFNGPPPGTGDAVALSLLLCFFLFCLYILGPRSNFQPAVNVWLCGGCVAALIWVTGNLLNFTVRPFIGQCALVILFTFFADLVGCVVHVGMALDRYLAVRGSITTLADARRRITRIMVTGAGLALAASLLVLAELGLGGAWNLPGPTGCARAGTLLGLRVKMAARGAVYLGCTVANVALTAHALIKLADVRLVQRRRLQCNLVLVAAITAVIWLAGACYSLYEAAQNSLTLCPKHTHDRLSLFLTSLTLLVLLAIYFSASAHLRQNLHLRPAVRSLTRLARHASLRSRTVESRLFSTPQPPLLDTLSSSSGPSLQDVWHDLLRLSLALRPGTASDE